MISQTVLEKALYDARLRVERDDSMRLRLVREEAEQQGIKIGEQRGITIGEQRGITLGEQRGLLYGQIQSFQQVLGLTVTLLDELHRMTSDECERLRADLLDQLSRRRG